jgi:PQQ-dependent dehydrogenase (methanol/ethanol family)
MQAFECRPNLHPFLNGRRLYRYAIFPGMGQGNPRKTVRRRSAAFFFPAANNGPRICGTIVGNYATWLRTGFISAALLLWALAAHAKDDGQWTMPAKDYANWRYSELNQIGKSNVSRLSVAWTFSTGINRGHEAAPLVVGKTMYIITPFPNILYALDLEHDGALKWEYEPKPESAAQGVACCDLVNRGAMFSDGRIYFNTLDAHTVAVDATTGKEVWKTKVGEINKGETITMAPLVVKDKVLVGNSGGEFGVRGWLTALDAKTGKVAWRAFSTGPDSDCLIGSEFKPFYAMDRGKDLGVQTWPPDHWKIGGGTVWGWISYDPELNLIYYGTGNPGSWNPELRPGDNKWTTGIFARRPEDGHAAWFYQWSPHDLYDHDGINESLLVDLKIDGRNRKTLLHAERNGYVYVMDRQTGEVISATPFVRITSSKGVDLKTGRLIPNPDKEPKLGKVVRDIAPVAPGAKDWQPCCWSPKTQLLYIPHQNLSMDFEAVEASYIEGTPYLGANVKMYAGPEGNRGELCAWDPLQKKKVWAVKEDFPVWSGTMVTETDILFYGTMEGWFKALDAKTGDLLWKFKTGSGIIGQPMTYLGPDGKQYVAVLSGIGGWSGAIVAGGLDPNDPTAALGFVNAVKDLPQKTTKGGMLYVFAIP